jgi:hypothetical protein
LQILCHRYVVCTIIYTTYIFELHELCAWEIILNDQYSTVLNLLCTSEHVQNSSTVFVNSNTFIDSVLYDNNPATCQEVTSVITSRDLKIRTDLSAPQTEVTVQWIAINWDCSQTARSNFMVYHNTGPLHSVNPFAGRFNVCDFHKWIATEEGVSLCLFHCRCPDGCSNIFLRIRRPLVGIKLCEVHISAGIYP